MATLRQTFSDIADAIRAKGVSGQTMKPIEMASKIGEIQTGGGSEDYGYLTLKGDGDNSYAISGATTTAKFEYSFDGVEWNDMPIGPYTRNHSGDVYIRGVGSNPMLGNGLTLKCRSDRTNASVSGDIRSLFGRAGFKDYSSGLWQFFIDAKQQDWHLLKFNINSKYFYERCFYMNGFI